MKRTAGEKMIVHHFMIIIVCFWIISATFLMPTICLLIDGIELWIASVLFPILIPILCFTLAITYWRIMIDEENETLTVYRLFRKPMIIQRSEIISVKKHLIPYREGIEYLMIRTKSQKLKVPRDVTNYEYFELFLRIDN